jgi:hypothetical protein
MRLRIMVLSAVCLGLLFAFIATAAASADTTLGSTTEPAGASAFKCTGPPNPTLIQSAQDPRRRTLCRLRASLRSGR